MKRTLVASVVLGALCLSSTTFADSVAQVATAKRISRQTVTLIDPQGRPTSGTGEMTNTLAKVGDILTFTIQFTPVPNGAYRGMGGYITDYIPGNTEVVGARIVDRDGNTVSPHRGGLACDGYGPRGEKWNTDPLVAGSMSQIYADTGIFFSTDPRTERRSNNPETDMDEAFLSLKNGLQMPQAPSGVGQFDDLLATTAPYFAHNEWDLAQVVVYGPGSGNGPEHVGSAGIGYGSPVAGPDSWYQLENTIDPPGSAIIAANSLWLENVGPWERIRTTGGEIGRRGQGDEPPTSPSIMPKCFNDTPTRVGVPAVDGGGNLIGWDLTSEHPLPAGTNAVRFALGELVVGDEYFAEISLRVLDLPLDPDFGDVNCAEVAGGDASSRSQDGGTGGKDYLWRYFLPAPACVSLDLLFENTVDKVLAAANSTLTNTIEVKNLATSIQTGVQVRDCFRAGDETLIAAGTTPGYTLDTSGAGCPNPAAQDAIVWDVGSLSPGEGRTYTVQFTGKASTSNQAVYSSDALPGFVATAYTTIDDLVVMRLSLEATPNEVATLPDVVHYTAILENVGTTAGTTMNYDIALPDAAWLYLAGTTVINDVPIAPNPTQTGAVVSFVAASSAATIAAGSSLKIEFDVTVPAGTLAGEYFADLTSWVKAGQDLEDSIFRRAPVAVLMDRSETPVVDAPLLQGETTITGSSSEAMDSIVTVYINGNPAGTGTVSAGGTFSVTVPAIFGGQQVTVTVEAAGELESFASEAVEVSGVSAGSSCSDGDDNDGDGLTDFPEDPGCFSQNDPDETDVPECSDGLDNNDDGLTDFPEDLGCSSFLDPSETGIPACSDGDDNDGDGETDTDDPGCSSADDVDEADVAACADGVDNDDDGASDFPADLGCSSSVDDTEDDAPGSGAGGDTSGPGSDDGGAKQGGTIIVQGDAPIPDPGAAPPWSTSGSSDDGGCGCRTANSRGSAGQLLAGLIAAAALARRRRRRN